MMVLKFDSNKNGATEKIADLEGADLPVSFLTAQLHGLSADRLTDATRKAVVGQGQRCPRESDAHRTLHPFRGISQH